MDHPPSVHLHLKSWWLFLSVYSDPWDMYICCLIEREEGKDLPCQASVRVGLSICYRSHTSLFQLRIHPQDTLDLIMSGLPHTHIHPINIFFLFLQAGSRS